MKAMQRTMQALAMLALVLLMGGPMISETAQAKEIVLRMAAPDWAPTRFLQDAANRTYKAKSGNQVRLEIDFIPWPNFYERVAASLTSGEKKYQMVVSDSQWLGAFIEGGYFLKLNKYIDADPELQKIMKDLHPSLVAAYSTYPHRSDNYYGFPQMPDTLQNWYRKDLFCNAREATEFKKQYGQKLPCTYGDWAKVDWNTYEKIGKFFRRSKGDKLGDGIASENFYGIAFQAGKGYDFSTMQINGFIWQYGGGIWDETKAPKGQAIGVVNSDKSIKAFETYLKLLTHAPPAHKTGQMDIFQIQELFMQGKVASIFNWVALAESALDPKSSKVADKIAFSMTPGRKMPNGKISRWSNVGGQPFVLTTWNNDEVVTEALELVKWWLSREVQINFAKNGGQSGLQSVMSSKAYHTYRPWNRAHVESLPWQKDVWHVPEFFELLTQQQQEFDKAITGQISAKEALNSIAQYQDTLLREAGRIQ